MAKLSKELFLEFLGTFWLTITIVGAVLAGVGVVGAALSLGLGVAAILFALGRFGSAHFNPAVTIAMFAAKKIDAKKGAMYILAQLVGGVAAAALLGLFFTNAASANYGATMLGPGIGMWAGVLIELFLTMFLLLVVFGTEAHHAPLAIGLVLAFDVLIGAGLTGASMNPARSFGSALMSGFWQNHLVYWIGPIAGGLAGGWLFRFYSKK